MDAEGRDPIIVLRPEKTQSVGRTRGFESRHLHQIRLCLNPRRTRRLVAVESLDPAVADTASRYAASRIVPERTVGKGA